MTHDGDLATALSDAVSSRELTAVFQPQVDISTRRIVAAEALCRWVHPTHGPIAPDVFIPLAEETGLIRDIGAFMIDESASVARKWHAAGARLGMSVNVSPTQLTQEFCSDVIERWGELRQHVPALTLELTESVPLVDPPADLARLETMREAGIGISLDDFGTGHASLAQLDWLPLTEVKLDRSLMQEAAPDAETELSTVVTHAHERGLTVVAEGIEDDSQLALARRIGCDRVQGFLLARPMGSDDVAVLAAA